MKSLEELLAIKQKAQAQIAARDADGNDGTRVVVGMATCGIAAGARPVLKALIDEIAKREVKHVSVTQTGCIGMCQYEPIVEVFEPGKEKVTYVKMTPDKVKRVVTFNSSGFNTYYRTVHSNHIKGIEDKVVNYHNEEDYVSSIEVSFGEIVIVKTASGYLDYGFSQ